MNYSASLEEGTPQQYSMKVMSDLLVQARVLNLDIDQFIGFFAAQVQAMLASPPNYNKFGQKARVWIMRGFYPGTPIFFKLTLLENTHDPKGGYYAKASALRTMAYSKRGTPYEESVILSSVKLNEDITNRMENEIFGAKHELKPLTPKKIRMPRCMSPRGLKVFRYEKKKNEKG